MRNPVNKKSTKALLSAIEEEDFNELRKLATKRNVNRSVSWYTPMIAASRALNTRIARHLVQLGGVVSKKAAQDAMTHNTQTFAFYMNLSGNHFGQTHEQLVQLQVFGKFMHDQEFGGSYSVPPDDEYFVQCRNIVQQSLAALQTKIDNFQLKRFGKFTDEQSPRFRKLLMVIDEYSRLVPRVKSGVFAAQLPRHLREISDTLQKIKSKDCSPQEGLKLIILSAKSLGDKHPILLAAQKCCSDMGNIVVSEDHALRMFGS